MASSTLSLASSLPLSESGARPVNKRPRLPRNLPLDDVSVVGQVKRAFAPQHRIAATVGLLAGGIVPLGIYVVAHQEAGPVGFTRAWALVAAGLAYSAPTVFQWAKMAFGNPLKAAGFVMLLEGLMVTSETPWLRFLALGYLMGINAIAAACALSQKRRAAATEA